MIKDDLILAIEEYESAKGRFPAKILCSSAVYDQLCRVGGVRQDWPDIPRFMGIPITTAPFIPEKDDAFYLIGDPFGDDYLWGPVYQFTDEGELAKWYSADGDVWECKNPYVGNDRSDDDVDGVDEDSLMLVLNGGGYSVVANCTSAQRTM